MIEYAKPSMIIKCDTLSVCCDAGLYRKTTLNGKDLTREQMKSIIDAANANAGNEKAYRLYSQVKQPHYCTECNKPTTWYIA